MYFSRITFCLIGAVFFLLLVSPTSATIEFTTTQSAINYITNAYTNFNISLLPDYVGTRFSQQVTFNNGNIVILKTVCWDQTININGYAGKITEMRDQSQFLYMITSTEGICYTTDGEYSQIVDFIISKNFQDSLKNYLKMNIFQMEASNFIPSYDSDIRIVDPSQPDLFNVGR